MAFSKQEIKVAKRKIIISSVIISSCWLIFLGFFIPACILVNDNNVLLFKIISIVIAIIASWVTIFITFNILIPFANRKNSIKRILGYEEKKYIGEVVSFSNERTVDKKIIAKELEIKLNNGAIFIFYADNTDDYSHINVGDIVEVKVRYHYLIEVTKL